ncbi:MAG TPA: ASKHA domain-containing protein [Bryobacteraceae bacterium]|nr:ASKHA domain-containing protein [Bryobacteraceae bacterium]
MPERLTLFLDRTRELRDLLFDEGVEFPCGGLSNCGGCAVRVVEGEVPADEEMRSVFSDAELAAGWRLGCRAAASGRVVLEIGQWQGAILTDESPLQFEPAEGLGVAIDLGTTTLVVQAVDLASGDVRAVRSALNPQAAYGADVMTRIGLDRPAELCRVIRSKLGEMVRDALCGGTAREILLAGNTVMHHLFCGVDVEPLTHAPFESPNLEERRFTAGELGWDVSGNPAAAFLPAIGGFVGSDVLCGMVAIGMLEEREPCALMDLGTNGEIVVGNRQGAVCASTAAGPAFEAGRIAMGMRAVRGAIDHVRVHGSALDCHVIGGGEARGVCGSGLVDAVAAGLDTGAIRPNGRLSNGARFPLLGDVSLSQRDIRELQLAKGAIGTGFDMLAAGRPVSRVYLAGAFGNYVDARSALRIGLVRGDPRQLTAAGNTSLRGARLLLLNPSRREEQIAGVIRRTRHVALAQDPEFMDRFGESLSFPAG